MTGDESAERIAELRELLAIHHDDLDVRVELAQLLMDRLEISGERPHETLIEIIELLRQAADLAVDKSAARRPEVLRRLGETHALRFWLIVNNTNRGEPDDVAEDLDSAQRNLDAAIEAMEGALAAATGDIEAGIAGDLGEFFHIRFRNRSAEDDLESAIRLLSKAANTADPDRADVAALGWALADRYDLRSSDGDRDAAIKWLRRVYDVLVQHDADHAIDLLRLAELLIGRGEARRDTTDVAAGIGYAQRALTVLPGDEPVRAYPLYTLGVGHFLRAEIVPAPDEFPIAAGHLREALAILPDDYAGHGEMAARFGVVLGAWVQHDLTGSAGTIETADALRARADEAVRLLVAARRDMPAEDVFLGRVQSQLAITLALRFASLGGGDDDHQTALTEFTAVLERPGLDVQVADICHLFMAYLYIVRRVPEELRQAPVRFDRGIHGRLMASRQQPSQDESRAALDHLDQILESVATSSPFGGLVSSLRAFAVTALGLETRSDDDIKLSIESFEEAIRATPEDDPDIGELRLGLSMMQGVRTERSGNAEATEQVVDSLVAAAEQLDDDHPMRTLFLSMLGGAFGAPPGDRRPSRAESAAAVDTLEAFLDEIPDDHPDRAAALIRQGTLLIQQSFSLDRSPTRLDKLRRRLREAIARPPADQVNNAANHCLLGIVDGIDGVFESDADRFNTAVERVKSAAGLAPSDHRIQTLVRTNLIMLFSLRFNQGGELEYLDAATYYARQALGEKEGDPFSVGSTFLAQYFLSANSLARNRHALDRGPLDEAITNFEALLAQLPETHEMRTNLMGDLATLRLLRESLGPDGLDLRVARRNPHGISGAVDTVVKAAKATPRENMFYPLNMSAAGNAKVLQGVIRRAPRLVNEGIALLGEAYTATESLPRYRVQVLGMLGMALRMRYEFTRDRGDLSNAIDRLEEARRAPDPVFGGELATALYLLALGYHERDDPNLADRRRSIETGLEALRERTGAVMLQSTTDRAFDSALAAAGEAADVARWCLTGDCREAAIEALERGRGMVVHAATADADIPFLLREAGHEDLAKEWETALREADAAGPAPWDTLPDLVASLRTDSGASDPPVPLAEDRLPSNLRYRAVQALQGSEVERLLAPPRVTEVVEALHTAGAGALVYLLPRDEGGDGIAVVIDTHGEVREIPLPKLIVGPHSRVAEFAEAQRELQLQGGEQQRDELAEIRIRRRWKHALEDLCDWAWTAAMEDVLEAVGVGPRSRLRLVLVPVGDLGLVPWHAARRIVAAGDRRYACQDAIISYAASARQFVDACRHRHRPWDSAAVLVRVGVSGLYFASKEIDEIRRRHYPQGTLLGGRGSGLPATAMNVSAQMPGPDAAGASLMHFGGHAVSALRPVDSHLLLDGDESLTMRDILRRARARPRNRSGGLILLAACGTHLTSRHHDEVLTLTTAFLAAGAVGAIGTRWPVNDLPTWVFMTMFHHYLNSGYDDPATALRAVQTWMLNPERPLPEYISAKSAEMIRTIDLTQASAWAAFTYQGQ